jgi:hypothetical protein
MQSLPAIVAVGGSLISAGTQWGAAKSAKRQGRTEAMQEELMATQREADRKERLANALASQNARAGAAGVRAFEGSPLSIMNEDIRREAQATERDAFNAELAGMTAKARGDIANRNLKTKSLLTIASGVETALRG